MKNFKKIFLKHNKLIVCLFLLLIVILTLFNIYQNEILNIDNYFYNLINIIRGNTLTNIMLIITKLGGKSFLIILTIFLIIIIKDKRTSISITSSLILVTIISQTIKLIVQRGRPIDMLIEETGYSFPSGHTMVSMAFYGLLIYFVKISKLSIMIKRIVVILLLMLIILISFSRIYLSVHYISDVIGGICLASIYLIIVIPIINNYVERK